MRCSAPLAGETRLEQMFSFLHHVFMSGRSGDCTCIGAVLPGETIASILAEQRRERLH